MTLHQIVSDCHIPDSGLTEHNLVNNSTLERNRTFDLQFRKLLLYPLELRGLLAKIQLTKDNIPVKRIRIMI